MRANGKELIWMTVGEDLSSDLRAGQELASWEGQ